MRYSWLEEYCLSKKGATSDFKIEWDARRFLLAGKKVDVPEFGGEV